MDECWRTRRGKQEQKWDDGTHLLELVKVRGTLELPKSRDPSRQLPRLCWLPVLDESSLVRRNDRVVSLVVLGEGRKERKVSSSSTKEDDEGDANARP